MSKQSFPFFLAILFTTVTLADTFSISDSALHWASDPEFNMFNSENTDHNRTETSTPARHITDPQKRLEYLVDQSWKLRNHLPERSLELGQQAIHLADSLNDYYNLVKAHSFVGVAHRLLGDYNKAIDIFFKGLELAKKHNIPQQEGYAYINIANLHIYLEFFSQALENLTPALEIAKEINDRDMLSYIFLNQGRVLMNLDSTDRAIESIEYAIEIRKETENIPGLAVGYKYLGDIYFNRNEFDQARLNYDLALSNVNKNEDKHLFGNIQLQLSKIYCKANNFNTAAPYAQQAFDIGREVNSRLLIHDALKVLSKVDLQKKNYEDAANRFIEINKYADTLFNQQLSEKVLGMEFQLERQKKQAEIDIIRKDQEIQALTLSRQRFLNLGLLIFTLLLFITGAVLLHLVRKLNQKNQQLSLQKDELKQINTAKDRMFMVIGHDLRSPVWNLRALIELLREDQPEDTDPEIKENFRALTRAVQSVGDLLENLLFWAKSQDGKIIFKPAPTDMKILVIKSIHPYKTWSETKNITIDYIIDDNATMVMADENMIQTVVRNLISNAIKYSFQDGKIEISLKKHEQFSRFSVKDFGRGINEEQIEQIHNEDVIPSSKGTGNEPGSGIGLSLCKDFIGKHKGKIMVESAPGSGTIFYFDLPLLPRPW